MITELVLLIDTNHWQVASVLKGLRRPKGKEAEFQGSVLLLQILLVHVHV